MVFDAEILLLSCWKEIEKLYWLNGICHLHVFRNSVNGMYRFSNKSEKIQAHNITIRIHLSNSSEIFSTQPALGLANPMVLGFFNRGEFSSVDPEKVIRHICERRIFKRISVKNYI